MDYRQLGTTDLKVSNICLGTMTWGEQNTEAEAFEQMDYATEQGINFFDTAELYPVPRKENTQGLTETYIGNWLDQKGNRDDIIIATKVVGRSGGTWFRDNVDRTRLDKPQITQAVEQSLKRLKTDYIDLYQLHWPDRRINLWGNSRGYVHHENDDHVPLEETLEALDEMVKQGKIRHVGLSNETAWGTMKCLHHAESRGLPRVQSVQNSYNLLNRLYEQDLSEVSQREHVSLLPYSPLGSGVLSGKYLNGQLPEDSRLKLYPEFGRYAKGPAEIATVKYLELAENMGISLVDLALKFCDTRPFVASTIIGATKMDQLRENIAAFDCVWTDEIEAAVEEIHKVHHNPAP